MERKIKNVGFVSTRIAGTDGVSLEIKKWTDVLERNRYSCFFFAGEIDRDEGKSSLVDVAHFEHPEIEEINKCSFGATVRPKRISDLIDTIKDKLKESLEAFIKRFDIDLIITENALTIPLNIPLGLAVTELIAETGIPTIAHHHDFYWERDRFLINSVGDYLHAAFPPKLPSIQHVVLNSIASQTLSYRAGVSNTIVPNVYDYASPPQRSDPEILDGLREKVGLKDDDIFILQPTRIVARKCIERSIDLVRLLNLPHPYLVISHASGDEGSDYFKRIKEYADLVNVRIVAIDHLIVPYYAACNCQGNRYPIGDVYQASDIVTYPSEQEGFGNAFLEAIYYSKPIIVNRYASFIADIEPKGFDLLLINGLVTKETVDSTKCVLSDVSRREQMVEKNYMLASKYFSYERLERIVCEIIERF